MEPEDPLISSDPAKDPRWWRVAFNDPTIDKLVDTALLQNLTLRSAALRVLQARQQLAIAIGNQYPQVQQGAGAAAKQRQQGVTVEEYNFGLNASWELDFWGRYRLAVESASAVLDSSVAVYDGALISLIAQVAQSYIALRTFEKRIAVAQFNVALQTESLRIAQAKLDSGDVSELDVNQAQSLLNNTRASVFNLRGSLQITRNSLAILLGALPG